MFTLSLSTTLKCVSESIIALALILHQVSPIPQSKRAGQEYYCWTGVLLELCQVALLGWVYSRPEGWHF